MLQLRSILKVVDNTGAKNIAYFKVLNGKAQDRACLGDTIIASVKTAKPHGQIKKGQIVKAVIIRQRSPYKRKDGTVIRFDDNAAVIVDEDNNPKGTKIIGPVCKEIRAKGYSKIISLAQEIL
jgi:large subunit ribosomal protein L14